MDKIWDIIIVGSGNAALCAGIAAKETGAEVIIIEKAGPEMAGGNTKYTAGAMRFSYDSSKDLLPLLKSPDDPRLPNTCLLYTSPSPRDRTRSRMPSSA